MSYKGTKWKKGTKNFHVISSKIEEGLYNNLIKYLKSKKNGITIGSYIRNKVSEDVKNLNEGDKEDGI